MVAGSFFSGNSNSETRMANAGPSTPIRNYGGNMGFQQDFGAGRVNNVRPKPGVSTQDAYGVAPVKKVEKQREENKYRKIAQGDTSPYSDEGFNQYMKKFYGEGTDSNTYQNMPGVLKRNLKDSYRDDVDSGYFSPSDLSSRFAGDTLIASADLNTSPIRFAGDASPTKSPSSTGLGITSRSIKQSTPTGRSSQFSGDGKGLSKTFSRPGLGISRGFGRSGGGTNTSSTGRKGGISKSTSRGQGGGTASRSKGGSFGGSRRSNTGSKSSSRGTSGSRGRGGTGTGSSRSGGTTGRKASSRSRGRTGRSRSQCDIRTKIDIAPLTNVDLTRDDLANVAYFVKEVK